MRRPVKKRAVIEPDIKYSNLLVAKLINKIMESGKKSIANKIVYGALEKAEKTLGKPAMDVLQQAFDGVAVPARDFAVGDAVGDIAIIKDLTRHYSFLSFHNYWSKKPVLLFWSKTLPHKVCNVLSVFSFLEF